MFRMAGGKCLRGPGTRWTGEFTSYLEENGALERYPRKVGSAFWNVHCESGTETELKVRQGAERLAGVETKM